MTSGNNNEHVDDSSPDLRADALRRLAETFPSALANDREVDWERLRLELGEDVGDGAERYTFKWAGKRDAVRIIQAPSRATLAPIEGESVNWEATSHAFVEGESLEVLKLLYKSYFERIRLVYLDPPYNTGSDRIYADNYADPLASYLTFTKQADEEGNLLTANPETSGRFHSSWLSMMYPRVSLARQLLREDGFIVVSIDDAGLHHVESTTPRKVSNASDSDDLVLVIIGGKDGYVERDGHMVDPADVKRRAAYGRGR